jgi:uncharacterized membrane protein
MSERPFFGRSTRLPLLWEINRSISEITSLKSWFDKRHAINRQRDFFDHRLRGIESAAEKAQYIRMNPVRAGLVTNPQDWPYQR